MRVTKETVAPNAAAAAQVLGNQNTAVATRAPMAVGTVSGERTSMPKFPTLQMVYGVGDLSTKFNQGSWVLDKEHLLCDRGGSLVVTFAYVERYLKQYVAYGTLQPGQYAKEYATRAEAIAAGEIVDWPARGSGGPNRTVSGAGRYILLVQKPEKLESAFFMFELGGAFWAPARMFLDKKAHEIVIGEIDKQLDWGLSARKGGLVAGKFSLGSITSVDKAKGKTYLNPTLKFVGAHSDADVEAIVSRFAASAASAVSESGDQE